MNKKTLVYALALLIVAGSVGAISASAHPSAGSRLAGWGKALFSQEEVEAKITEKVADGTITQEQADQKLEWLADAEVRRAEMQTNHDEHVAEVAEFLGLSVEEFEAQVEAGSNPWEIAQAQGVSEEEIKEFHQAHRLENAQERLQAMVDIGKLTQEQADERLEKIESGDFIGMGRMGAGSHGKRGGMHKGGFGFGN